MAAANAHTRVLPCYQMPPCEPVPLLQAHLVHLLLGY